MIFELSTSQLDLGAIPLGQKSTAFITVTNPDTVPHVVNVEQDGYICPPLINCGDPNPPGWLTDFVMSTNCMDAPVPAGGSCVIWITFSPTAAGDRQGGWFASQHDAIGCGCSRWIQAFRANGTGLVTPRSSASVQYSYDIDVTPSAPATCTSTLVTQPVTGSSTVNLPTTGSNVVAFSNVNGVESASAGTIAGPFPSTFQVGALGVPVPSVKPPYTFQFTVLPLDNGGPVGVGWRVSGVCAAGGAATFTLERGILALAAAAALPVPTMSHAATVLLALLLAMLGVRISRWSPSAKASVEACRATADPR